MERRIGRRRVALVSALFALATGYGFVAGWDGRQVEAQNGPRATDALAQTQLPECPFHYYKDANNPLPAGPDIGAIADIPEFHDCQGFEVRGAFQGPYAVYSLFDQQDVWPAVQRSAKRAPAGMPGGTPEGKGEARLAAVIRNFGAPYNDLFIGRDYSCVYLFLEGARTKGVIVPNGTSSDCPNSLPASNTSGRDLFVTRDASEGIEHYPQAARWEREAGDNGRYLIGLYCNGWCVLGPAGFVAPPGHTAAGSPEQRRVFQIKGWFDAQSLAVPHPGAPGQPVVPGPLHGAVFPHPNLDSYVDADFLCPTGTSPPCWTEVASVALPGNSTVYDGKLNLKNSPVPTPARMEVLNRVYLCKGSRDNCGVPPTVRCSWAGGWPAQWATGDTDWWARFDPPPGLGSSRYRCVVRRAHPAVAKHIPGSARWRWQARDETIWVRCSQGCCEVDA